MFNWFKNKESTLPFNDDFKEYSKIQRLSKQGVVVSEKIDGTNAQLLVGKDKSIKVGSRNRWLTLEDDNFGFNRWVFDHHEELSKLPPGRYYGEWWGSGIQRGYGKSGGEKRFSLFAQHWNLEAIKAIIPCIDFVPILFEGNINTYTGVHEIMEHLKMNGSVAAPGFMNPEGVVVYFKSFKQQFKATFNDEAKGN